MGKGALIAAAAISFIAIVFISNTQVISRDTGEKQLRYQSGQIARELALKGRKLVLANWIAASGAAVAQPFNMVTENGGTISIVNYSQNLNVLDFTVRGVFEGAVHDIRSRYQWTSFSVNPFQLSVPDLTIDIAPGTTFNFPSITLDDLALADLEDVLIDELSLGDSLGQFGLGLHAQNTILNQALTNSGHSTIGIDLVESGDRDLYDEQNGLYFPNQVEQAIENYVIANPGSQTVYADGTGIPSTFGGGEGGMQVLRIENNVTLAGDLVGEGVLIVEGDFVVPEGVALDWRGIVLIKTPNSELSPVVNLQGNVNIAGSLVVTMDGVPNTGHMDFTINYSSGTSWSSPNGDNYPWWRHTHDFSGRFGNQVGFISSTPGFTVRSYESRFEDLLHTFAPSASIYLELHNHHKHGRAILTIDLTGEPAYSYPVAAGFDPNIANPTNPYMTRGFRVDELEHLDIIVTRLSSLKKLWDSVEGHPGCADARYWDGPRCVAADYNRYEALALRVYHQHPGSAIHHYDASLYWHRRQDEEEEFENEMTNLLDDITSTNYGVDIDLGNDVTISADNEVTAWLGGFGGIGGMAVGVSNIGTWHTHWDPYDPNNPLHSTP